MAKPKINKVKFAKFILILLLTVYAGKTLIAQQIEITQTKKQLKIISAEIDEQTKIKKDLTNKKEIANTPSYIEKIARNNLNYAAPNEIIFMDAALGF